jgi:hypothetical protein
MRVSQCPARRFPRKFRGSVAADHSMLRQQQGKPAAGVGSASSMPRRPGHSAPGMQISRGRVLGAGVGGPLPVRCRSAAALRAQRDDLNCLATSCSFFDHQMLHKPAYDHVSSGERLPVVRLNDGFERMAVREQRDHPRKELSALGQRGHLHEQVLWDRRYVQEFALHILAFRCAVTGLQSCFVEADTKVCESGGRRWDTLPRASGARAHQALRPPAERPTIAECPTS